VFDAFGYQCGLEGRTPRAAWFILFHRNDLSQLFYVELGQLSPSTLKNPVQARPLHDDNTGGLRDAGAPSSSDHGPDNASALW
jgi:hypothetical protein